VELAIPTDALAEYRTCKPYQRRRHALVSAAGKGIDETAGYISLMRRIRRQSVPQSIGQQGFFACFGHDVRCPKLVPVWRLPT